MEGRPSLRALNRKIQFGPRICVAERFAHWFAVKAQLGNREHAIGIDPGIRTADGILDFPAPRIGKMRDVVYPQISVASDVAQTEAGNQVEKSQQLGRFVPGIADQPFVRALSGEHDFLSATVDASRELKQSGAGRV